jgi:hypothetical protein
MIVHVVELRDGTHQAAAAHDLNESAYDASLGTPRKTEGCADNRIEDRELQRQTAYDAFIVGLQEKPAMASRRRDLAGLACSPAGSVPHKSGLRSA